MIPLFLLPALVVPGCAEKTEAPPAPATEPADVPEQKAGAATAEAAAEERPDFDSAAPPPPAGARGYRGKLKIGSGTGRPHKGEEGRFGPGGRDNGLLERDVQAGAGQDMYFEHYGVNPTIDTAEEPRSTFAVDVDTASFTMARAFLERGQLPVEAAVRVEEIVNAFDYGYEAPSSATFAVHAEAAPSPNREGYHVLHVGLKGKEVAKSERKAANLVFVIDVSGSMDADNRLGLVKRSLRLLVEQLEEADKVGVVTYGSTAREVLQLTSAHDKQRILQVIEGLTTEGATNAEAGIRLGYQMASRSFRQGGINRVVLCSDGVANMGMTGPAGLLDMIGRETARGITISSVGFGMGNYNDVLMEKLANKGNGNYHYVDKLDEARRVFVEQLTGTLQVIAKDVKIQVQFDPKAVARYRLIGYENRALQARDFDNDRVDAGEVGAGHSVTAIYEVKLKDGFEGSLGKVRIRYKQPAGSESALVEKALSREMVRSSTGALSSPTQLSLAAAQLAEKLRGSYWARNLSYDDILKRIDGLGAGLRGRADVSELRDLVQRARQLDRRGDKFAEHGPVARMDFDRVPVLR
jgi:Ca-activated chloride channel family protein